MLDIKEIYEIQRNLGTKVSQETLELYYTKLQVDKKISDLVATSPESLDTLNELANALGNDPNFATTVLNKIGEKANTVHPHTVNEISDFPSSMPADGGDAATLCGYKPQDFLPSNGGYLNGNLRTKGAVYTEDQLQIQAKDGMGVGNFTSYFKNINGEKEYCFDNVLDLKIDNKYLYHQGRKPLANDILFSDGQSFQNKLDSGLLTGPKGSDGTPGTKGDKGDKGDKGNPGDPLQIENSFNGGVGKAISAEKGKELHTRVTELEDTTALWTSVTGEKSVTINNSLIGFTKDLTIKGKTIGGYNSETSQSDNIVSTGQAEGDKIVLKSVGKNLCPIKKFESNSPRITMLENPILVQNNTNYVFSLKKIKCVSFAIFLSNTISKETNHDRLYKAVVEGGKGIEYKTIEKFLKFSSASYKYVYVTSHIDNQDGVSVDDMQLEQGTIATEYEEYKFDKKEILLPMESGLKEWDCIDFEKGEISEKSNISVITNDTTIRNWGSPTGDYIGFSCAIPNSKDGRNLIKSNKFNSIDGNILSRNAYIVDKTLYMCIERSSLETQDIDGFKKWLQANPTTIVYKLETPIVHNIEKICLPTYEKVTHIIQDNNVSGEISCQAPADRDASIISLNDKINTTRNKVVDLKNETETLKGENVKINESITVQDEKIEQVNSQLAQIINSAYNNLNKEITDNQIRNYKTTLNLSPDYIGYNSNDDKVAIVSEENVTINTIVKKATNTSNNYISQELNFEVAKETVFCGVAFDKLWSKQNNLFLKVYNSKVSIDTDSFKLINGSNADNLFYLPICLNYNLDKTNGYKPNNIINAKPGELTSVITLYSDLHFKTIEEFRKKINLINYVNRNSCSLFSLGLGDNVCENFVNADKNKIIDNITSLRRMLLENSIVANGNHDTNSWNTLKSKVLMSNELFKYHMKGKSGISSINDDFYYFYDDNRTKVRYIILNSCDTPRIEQDKDNWLYRPAYTPCFSEKQIKWLSSVALKTDYDVAVFSHHGLLTNNEIDYQDRSVKNADIVREIIKKFKNKERGVINKSDGDFSVYLEYDFTSTKGSFIAEFFGHYHFECKYKDSDNIWHIGIDDMLNDGSNYTLTHDYLLDNSRDKTDNGDPTLRLIKINTNAKVCDLISIGAGSDFTFNYKQ